MKLSKIFAAAALGSTLVAGTANAGGHMMDDLKFYVGADAAYNSFSWGDDAKSSTSQDGLTPKKYTPSLSLLGGLKFHENVGVELGYTFFKKKKLSDADKIKNKNIYMDVMGFMPVADQVELLGAVGLGRHKVKWDGVINKGKTAFRLGGGAQYKFDECLASRVMVRYQKLGHIDDINDKQYKGVWSLGLGVNYSF